MEYVVCCVPVGPLRAGPSHRAEMVTQQLFGEKSIVVESLDNEWVRIKMKYDDYEGWCQQSHITGIDDDHYLLADHELTGGWINEVDYNGHMMYVPLGSSLSAFDNGRAFWRKNQVHYKGERFKPEDVIINAKSIKLAAYKYLNTSYLWGGKSVFGIDCSGFTQMVYRSLNKRLPRDAWQQANVGDHIEDLRHVHCGDLAFFDNDESRITHVGLMLDEHEIIHSSGKVRIDKIDKDGILNLETKQRTHKLRIIKRYF
ncbi:MAG: C40 family peptidase [Ginsengibacter sp.]